ncbi:Dph6-related ATP pyrophosphatase [Thermonema rossianum]|uniref:Dph6-related ATP pyrophosphatase n=1 Tax=Thermonema rossianum TaxID=55505 RepID=UPI0012FCD71A|nr:ATP-binding protein [Thermonema rossianum]
MLIHLSWSGGKDSALCYARLRQLYPQACIQLHCAVNESLERVSMHGVPLSLIEAQAQAMNTALRVIHVPAASDNSAYEQVMLDFYRQIQAEGCTQVAFGDLHLEDLRQYRLALCRRAGIHALFPLWKEPYSSLSKCFEKWQIRTLICAADLQKLPADITGKDYNPEGFARRFPDVDMFGEKGEFHTFVYDAAFFQNPLPVSCRGIRHQAYHYTLADGRRHTHTYAFADLVLSEAD